MAKSSHEYAKNAQVKGETEERAATREAVIEAFEASGGTYGYRRIYAQVNADTADGAAIGEWTVRSIMEEERLAARAAKRRRRYSSYAGEISEAPENPLRDERDKRHFRAGRPNELWIADVTEFRIPAGKARLSPVIDCFGGMPLSWSISTSPDAETANSSLLGACGWPGRGGHPRIHSDRGCRYRWPGWIIMKTTSEYCAPDFQGYFFMSLCQDSAGNPATPLARSSPYRAVAQSLLRIMDGYQSAVYLLAFASLVRYTHFRHMHENLRMAHLTANARPCSSYAHLVLDCIVFTGLGCYLLWEAKGVYVLPFFIVLLPLSVEEIVFLSTQSNLRLKGESRRRGEFRRR